MNYFPGRRPPPMPPATEYNYSASRMQPMQVPLPSAHTGGGFAPQPTLVPQMSGGLPPQRTPMPNIMTGGGLPPSHMGRLWQLANGEQTRPRQIRQGLFGLVP